MRDKFLHGPLAAADDAAASQQRSEQRGDNPVNVEHRHRRQRAIVEVQRKDFNYRTGTGAEVRMTERDDFRPGRRAGRLQHQRDVVGSRKGEWAGSVCRHSERVDRNNVETQGIGCLQHLRGRLIAHHDPGHPEPAQLLFHNLPWADLREWCHGRHRHPREQGCRPRRSWWQTERQPIGSSDAMIQQMPGRGLHRRRQCPT